MFSVFLAGAAVLEIHRALHRPPGDPDVEAIQKREADLKAALEAVQRELKSEKQQRERAASATKVLESERASLQAQQAALQAQQAALQAQQASLQASSSTCWAAWASRQWRPDGLYGMQYIERRFVAPAQAEKAALEDQSKLLLRRFGELEASASDLQSTNDGLLQQVAAAVEAWSAGGLDAAAFLGKMATLGVRVHLAPEGVPALPAPQQITPNSDLHLTMDETWTSKMQLLTDSKERMSRLLTAAAAREGSLQTRSTAALTFPMAKTPPKDAGMSRRLNMSSFGIAGLTPRKAQALLDMGSLTFAEPAQPAAQPAAQPKQQPLGAIENVPPPVPPPQQQKALFAKVKGERKGGRRTAAMPKLEFAAFDSDEGFGSSHGRDLMRL